MPVPILSDGVPLTYEWLNAVANAINTIEINYEANSNITITGTSSEEKDYKILVGKQAIKLSNANKTRNIYYRENIKFSEPFPDDNVTVVAMVTTTNANTNKPQPAGVAVGGITATNFDITVQMFDDSEKFKKEDFEVRYIAIGTRPL